ncbi:hypothetical protein [Streptomyces sp. NPDC053367]|uniref:hypothetical protein n=1 Tax=Streptomyces sp. NPDC053367 TaxID=3365700 RepID=UPI0037D63E02
MRLLPARYFGRAHGRHRRAAGFPHPEFGAVVTQGFAACDPCGGDVPVVLHPSGGHTCQAGHTTAGGAR